MPSETLTGGYYGYADHSRRPAFFILWVALINSYFCICALRTNVILELVLFFIEVALLLVASAYWVKAQGNLSGAAKLQEAGGAFVFVFCVFGWYLEMALMLQSVDFPWELPTFDLSSRVRGAKDKEGGEKAA